MDIKYIKELGTGFSGTVYLVKIKNKLCSLKIQHIFKKDLLNKKSELWNEIAFYKYVSDFYPIFKKTLCAPSERTSSIDEVIHDMELILKVV